jgi:amino acid permease
MIIKGHHTFQVDELRRQTSNGGVSGVSHRGELGTWGAVFAILSTLMGGGMVSIPWAFYSCGFPVAILLLMLSAAQVVVSCVLYLKARNICPDCPTSMFEIGFLILGRKSIFWIAFTILVTGFLMPIVYMNVFGDVMKGLVVNLSNSGYAPDGNLGL